MIAIAIRFPGGRFHATPWGHHVNEGVPEWPPSPWRLLRAMVATWKRKLDDDPSCPAPVVESLLRKMASPPVFSLPPASTGHARHYMPWFKKGPGDRTLIFDTFVAVEKSAEVAILWPGETADAPERAALERLAAGLSFVGRAESWAEVRILCDDEAARAFKRFNCAPLENHVATGDMEFIRVLCPDPDSAFDNEHTPAVRIAAGRRRRDTRSSVKLYDPDWHLCLETLELHDKGWSDPPGSRWLTYLRPKACFVVSPRLKCCAEERPLPVAARFILDATVLPPVEDTLRIAEVARITAMGCHRRVAERCLGDNAMPGIAFRPRSEVLSGKDAQGRPLRGHRHAHYLPADEDGDGRIDHLTIFAPMGFGKTEAAALDRMRLLKLDRGDPVRLLLLALGQRETIAGNTIFGPSRVWESATPFLVTRHAKSRGRKKDPPHLLGPDKQREFARHVLLEEFTRLREVRPDIPEPISVEPLNEEHRCGTRRLRPIQFRRFRRKRGDDGGRRSAGAFRITFPQPVWGPICLGHSSHFGLGLFVAAGSES
ncbi:MAG: type I-U CRISPR-associated protein Cas5/Cas6 [Acidobacteria bacterium]|nr:type I-U CRISPR-associated protein Cas5/Cas6 [Acidobacteriota bacterium]